MKTKRFLALALTAALLLALLPAAQATPGVMGCRASADGRHSWRLVDDVPATCTEAGWRYYACDSCGAGEREETAALGHNWVRGDVDYTGCTTTAYAVYYCSRCQDETVREEPGPGHDWREVSRVEGNCTTAGSVTYVCRRCQETKTETIAATGKHTFGHWEVSAKATCTERQLDVRRCTVCGEREYRYSGEPLGHDWADDPANPGKQVCLRCNVKGDKPQGGEAVKPEPAVLPAHLDEVHPEVTASGKADANAGAGKRYVGAQVPFLLEFTNTGDVPVYLCFDDEDIWAAIQSGSEPAPNGLSTVKNPLSLGQTTGALLNPGQGLGWPYVAQVDADAVVNAYLGFGFTAPFLYEDVDGVMKSGSSTMGFVGVELTAGEVPPEPIKGEQHPAVTASARWAPDAGEGKRFEGALVDYEIVLENTGDTPVYICYDMVEAWDEIMAGSNPPPHGLSTVKNPYTDGNTTGALLEPGEKLSRPTQTEVTAAEVITGVVEFLVTKDFAYEDLNGDMKAGNSSPASVSIPLTDGTKEEKKGYDKIDLTLKVTMTSPEKAVYMEGDVLTFQVTLRNNSTVDLINPQVRGDTIYDEDWVYQAGVDRRNYDGAILPKGDAFTVTDTYTVRPVDIQRGSMLIAWRGFAYPDYATGGPDLPPEWSDPVLRPETVQWSETENRAIYFRTKSFEQTYLTTEAKEPALALTSVEVTPAKAVYEEGDTVIFSLALTNTGNEDLEVPTVLADLDEAIGKDTQSAYYLGDFPAGDSLAPPDLVYIITPPDVDRGYAALTFGGQAWRQGGFDGTTDAYSDNADAVQSNQIQVTLPVAGTPPVPDPKPKGEPKLALYAETKYPAGGYSLDGEGKTGEIPYILTIVNEGDEPFEVGYITVKTKSHTVTTFAGIGVLYPHEIRDYEFDGTVLTLADLTPGTDEPGILGTAQVSIQYTGSRVGEWLWDLSSNEVILEHVILDAPTPPEPEPDPAGFEVVKKEISTPVVSPNGYVEGENIVYEITVTNHTGAAFASVPVYDILAMTGYEDYRIDTLLNIQDGESRTVYFTYQVDGFDVDWGYVKNKAYVVWEDPVTKEEVYSYSDGVYSPTDDMPAEGAVTLVKEAVGGPKNGKYYQEGEPVTFKVTLDNGTSHHLINLFVYDSLIPEEEYGKCLATYLEAPAGFHAEVEFTYYVTAGDVEAESLSNIAHLEAVDTEGNIYQVISNEVSVPTGKKENTVSLLQRLEIVKEVTGEPANHQYYQEGETILYAITLKNPNPDFTFYDIEVFDILEADDPNGKILHLDSLAPGEEYKIVDYPYTVQDTDIPLGQVANRASAAYVLQAEATLMQNVKYTDLVESNWVYSKVGKQTTVERRQPKADDCCQLTLTALGDYSVDYTQHFCAEHGQIESRVQQAVLSARTEEAKRAAWQQAEDLWRSALDDMYKRAIRESKGEAKAALMDDQIAFSLYLDALKAELSLTYPDQPARVAELVAQEMRDRTTELCYLIHKAPAVRADSILTGVYTSLTDTAPAYDCIRTEMTGGSGDTQIRLALDDTHGRLERATILAQTRANTREKHLQCFDQARGLWRMALDQLIGSRYQWVSAQEQQAINLLRAQFDRMLEKREAVLNAFYPDQPEAAAEQAVTALRNQVVLLCMGW